MTIISVVIPVRNGMPYLPETIDSVLNQGLEDMEIIVSDDHSTDGTTEYLLSIQDERVKIVHPRVKMPVAEHWSFVTQLAKGKYIKLLCADDLLEPQSLIRSIRILEESGANMLYGNKKLISPKSRKIWEIKLSKDFVGIHQGVDVFRRSLAAGRNIFGEPSNIIFRADNLKGAMPWKPYPEYLLDLHTYMHAMSEGTVIGVDMTLSSFRIHGKSISSNHIWNSSSQFISFTKAVLSTEISLRERTRIRLASTFVMFARMLISTLIKSKII